jgi:hypothetical protein
MKQKVVKLEIGKLVAIVIAVVVVAFAAGFYIQSSYFQGMVGVEKTDTLMDETMKLRALVNRPNVSDRAVTDAFKLFETELGKRAEVGKENANRITENLLKLSKVELNRHLSAFEVNSRTKPFSEAYLILDDATTKSVEAAKLDATLK